MESDDHLYCFSLEVSASKQFFPKKVIYHLQKQMKTHQLFDFQQTPENQLYTISERLRDRKREGGDGPHLNLATFC